MLLAGTSGMATVWTTNGSWSALNYISTNCAAGDVINITPGTNTWFQHISFYDVQLIWSGTNTSEVIDETPITGSGDSLLEFSTGPQFWRISGCNFHVGVTNTYTSVSVQVGNASAAVRGNINIYGTNVGRVDHCIFYQLTGKPVRFPSLNYSVCDHDSFQMYGGANAMECEGTYTGDPFGDYSWSTPGAWGTSNAAVFLGGNVGIGTTGPSTALQVMGTVTATSLASMGSVYFQTNATGFNWSNIPAYSATITNYWMGTWTNGTLVSVWSNTSSSYVIKQLAP